MVSVPAEAVVANPIRAGAVRDDDRPPSLTIADAEAREDSGEALEFPLTLSAPSDKFVTVAAAMGADYDEGEHEGS